MQFLADRGIAIVAVADTPHRRNGGRSALALAGDVLNEVLAQTGLSPDAIDGLCVGTPLSEAGNPFWPGIVADGLGLEVAFAQSNQLGGGSALANLSRAAMAIETGVCELVFCVVADAVSTVDRSLQSGYRVDYADPAGYGGPPAAFGLISAAYAERYGPADAALARIATVQRAAALANSITVDVLRKPLSEADYYASRMIADPVRLLDCVMRCDGANGLLVMRTERARALGMTVMAHPIAYREVTNIDALRRSPGILSSGFEKIAGPLFSAARLLPTDIDMLQLYDDFTIAVLMQIEHLGFAPLGGGVRAILDGDISASGTLPVNTGGGQLSCGQPGLASGGVNLTEALKQLLGKAHGRQVAGARHAIVTGIGGIEYARNWGTSSAMILEAAQ